MERKFTLNPKRSLRIAYNPETKEWHMKCREAEYISDIISVKNIYAIESNMACIYTNAEITEQELSLLKMIGEVKFEEWRIVYPNNLFPNEKFNPF